MRILQVSRMSPARRAESSLAAFSLVEAICRAGHQITYAWFPDRRDWEDILAARELVEACQGNLTLLPLAGKANWLDDPRRALWAAARASAVLGPRLLHMLANRPADAIHALQRLAYLVRRFDPRPVRQLERLLSANAFDLVQFDYPWTMRLAGQLRLSAPSVFVAHEVQYEIFRQMFPGDRGLHLAVRRRERRALRRYSAVLALSREDAAVLHDEMKLPRVHCSPLPLPLRPLQAPANVHRPGEAVQFSFLGGYRHHPNLDALRWLARDIVPRLRLAFPYMKLRIVGRWPQRHQRRIKILDAVLCGLPVVSTRVGVRGLGLAEEEHYLPADTAEAFVDQAVRLVRHAEQADRMVRAAQQHVLRSFSPDAMARQRIRVLREVAGLASGKEAEGVRRAA